MVEKKLYFKTMRGFFYKYFCVKEGYRYLKSNRTKNRSYYFKKYNNATIRVSNHYLHPKQERKNTIDLVIINTDSSTVNKKPIYFPCELKIKEFKKIALNYVLLERALYSGINKKPLRRGGLG